MGANLATVVVEQRLLVREALKSLMANNSCHVVCDVGSTAEISVAAVSDEPKLVVLGAQSADDAVAEADAIRKLWPDSKIILLYEHASSADVQKLLASEINGCVPLFASPDTLIGVLDMSVIGGTRVMVVPGTNCPAIQPAQREQSHRLEIAMDGSKPHGGQPKAVTMQTQPAVNGAGTSGLEMSNGGTQRVPPLRSLPKLSEREVQILNGLVRGDANKVIARRCDLAEATVKVHIKSILRKIRLGNRTQAAVWALENGYAAHDFKGSPVESDIGSNQITPRA
jgi:two-component system nitrate/nitrite response regulator NarL